MNDKTPSEYENCAMIRSVKPESIEIELKIGLWATDSHFIAQSLNKTDLSVSNPKTHRLENIYFDTASGILYDAGLAIRIRNTAGSYEMTAKLKTDEENGLFSRYEWNFRLQKPALDFTSLQCLPLPAELRSYLTDDALRPVFRDKFDRTEWYLTKGESEVKLAFDRGFVFADMRRSPISELEFELVKGKLSSLVEIGLDISDLVPSFMAVISKAERGQRLAYRSHSTENSTQYSSPELLNRLSRALDPLSGPDYMLAIETLQLIDDGVLNAGFYNAIQNQRLPLGLTRWMFSKAMEWGAL